MLTGFLLAGVTSPVEAARNAAGKDQAASRKSAPQPDASQNAEEEYHKGVELFQVAQVQRDKGNVSGQKQLLREAIRRFEAALSQNPKLVEAQSNIGFAWLTLQEHRRAVNAFEKALAINPQHLNTLNGLATTYAFDNRIELSIQTFDKLTTLDPGNSQYYFNKGSVLQKAGRLEDARRAYEQALKINPNDQRSLFNMGTLLENQGLLAEARPFYEQAKDTEIGNTIGLEAIRRLEALEQRQQTGQPGRRLRTETRP